jgi:hypothetical protein
MLGVGLLLFLLMCFFNQFILCKALDLLFL